MPFKKSARVTLKNESDHDLYNYTSVDWQSLPAWSDDVAYFHASWQRYSFQLTLDTKKTLFSLTGPGKFVGMYWFVQSDEPLFKDMALIVEADNEYRIDGETAPSINYLGSECAYNFCWGWRGIFNGYKIGTNLVNNKPGETLVSTFRFRDRDAMYFDRNLELTLNWTTTFKNLPIPQLKDFLNKVRDRNSQGGGWVDYAVATYCYSFNPEGTGVPLPPLEERLKPLLHPNPLGTQKPS